MPRSCMVVHELNHLLGMPFIYALNSVVRHLDDAGRARIDSKLLEEPAGESRGNPSVSAAFES